jgi:hypothetical protein
MAGGSHFTARAPVALARSSASIASARYGWTEAIHSKRSGREAAIRAAYSSGTQNVVRSSRLRPASSWCAREGEEHELGPRGAVVGEAHEPLDHRLVEAIVVAPDAGRVHEEGMAHARGHAARPVGIGIGPDPLAAAAVAEEVRVHIPNAVRAQPLPGSRDQRLAGSGRSAAIAHEALLESELAAAEREPRRGHRGQPEEFAAPHHARSRM